jgi:YVTN family beta-propeller protein
MTYRITYCVWGSLISLATVAALHAASAEYHIVARFPVPGDTAYYDYLRVDSEARQLYVTHDKRVEVLDADSGKKVGEIAPTARAHGVAIARDTGHGFATSGLDNQITMFDLKTFATLKQVKSTGSNPDAIEYDPDSKRIYVGNHGSGDVTVIDPSSGDIVGTVKFGEGKLEGLAFDGRGQGFVNAEDKSAVFVFDLKTLEPKAKWSVAPGEGGTGLAVDKVHHRLFSACANNKVVVLDSDSGKVIATPAIGEDPDGVTFEPATGRIFSSNVDGTLTIIQEDTPDKFTVLQNVTTQRGCRTITLDEKTGRVVTCAPQYGPTPAPVKGGPKPKAPVLPGTFEAIVVGLK